MSLRARLLLAVGAIALVALVAADFATYSSLRSFLYDRVDQSLDTEHLSIEAAVVGHHDPNDRTLISAGTFVQVRDANNQVLGSEAAREPGGKQYTAKLPDSIPLASQHGPGDSPVYLTVPSVEPSGPQFRVRVSTLQGGGQLVVGYSLEDTIVTLDRLRNIELAVTAAALGAAVLLGWWLVKVGLQPLTDVEATANAIAEGDLDRRVPGDEPNTEVGRLARSLNVMLERIRDAFTARDATEAELRRSEERLRRFVADASHELRTPLAAVAAYSELFDRGASQRPEDLARAMHGIRTEAARMHLLVEDLLLLARLDEGRPLKREPVELVAVAGEAAETARAVGSEWPIKIEARLPVEIVGDAGRIRQVFDNLLANVRAHTPPGTATTIRITQATTGDAPVAVFEVSDSGPGLTEEQAAKAFERFYRVEASRSRQHGGGAGLGLAIVAAIVGAHGGRVDAVAHGADGGAAFIVRLPLAAPIGDEMLTSGSQPALRFGSYGDDASFGP
jgi:two-component system OmpR family sensor kinase